MPELTQEEHFASAATRHFRDGDYLREGSCLPSADHLYGFAAECAVKSLLLRFTEVSTGPLEGEKRPSKRPRAKHPEEPNRTILFGHVNELVGQVGLFARGRSGAPLHALVAGDLRVFEKWDVSDRYRDGRQVRADAVDDRRDAAHRILSLHEQAVINRRLP
ncbi:hypothetical protein ACRWOO_00515 [Streptomyces sp. NEAU-PBA10]|uniref:hypothetical protein n=1 Tax=Streptomyces TaxID=1883 RepID=UPI0004CD26B0|nr:MULTISPECIES: hypothetical protein [unclassified Streptomyces]MCQ9707396.1 hypothetical protein [Streptomyces sp. BSP1]